MINLQKAYINILLQDLVKTVQIATKHYFDERYMGKCSMIDSENKLNEAMKKVDAIKDEIFYVISLVEKT